MKLQKKQLKMHLNHPRPINMDLVDAQQARRVLRSACRLQY